MIENDRLNMCLFVTVCLDFDDFCIVLHGISDDVLCSDDQFSDGNDLGELSDNVSSCVLFRSVQLRDFSADFIALKKICLVRHVPLVAKDARS